MLLWLLWKFAQTPLINVRSSNIPHCRANFLSICPRIKVLYTKLLEIENYGRTNSRLSRLASGAHFPTFLTIFKTALVSIIFILELSVLHKSCLELNFARFLTFAYFRFWEMNSFITGLVRKLDTLDLILVNLKHFF